MSLKFIEKPACSWKFSKTYRNEENILKVLANEENKCNLKLKTEKNL